MSEETFAKIAGRDLSRVVTTHQLGLPTDKLDFYAGSFETMEAHFRKIAHKPVLTFLGTLFDSFGEGETKVAKHIKALAKFPIDHSRHTKRATHDIFDTITSYAGTFEKAERVKAAGILDHIPGVGGAISDTALTVGSLATALTGAGAGAAYWHANKESQEDDYELEAKRKKIKYYRGLVDELKQRAKYS